MASARRRPADRLIDLLRSEPHRFDSRQAVRILETRQGRLKTAPVSFRSSLSMTFATSDIETIQVPQDRKATPTVTVRFLGLGGATGPLPTPYTEHVGTAARRGDMAGRDFLDVFNHRLVTLAMDLAKLYRPALQPGLPQHSSLARQSYALLGLATPSLIEQIPALAPALLPLTPLINRQPLSAHAIERAVSAHFHVPARVIPFIGGWIAVPGPQRSALGLAGCNQRLGQTAMLGGRLWDQSAGIVLELGPMSLDQAERFLPTASVTPGSAGNHATLSALLDFMIDGAVSTGVRLLVRTDSLRPARLSRRQPMRLGWTSWLHGGRPGRGSPPRLGHTARLGTRQPASHDAPAAPPTRLGGRHAPSTLAIRLRPRIEAPVA